MALRVIDGGSQSINGMGLADYIWLDGLGGIHVKKKAIFVTSEAGGRVMVPILDPWVATVYLGNGVHDRILLNPAHYLPDPLRGENNYVVLCEVRDANNIIHKTNTRAVLRQHVMAKGDPLGTWWGFKQVYRFTGHLATTGGAKGTLPSAAAYLAAERHLCVCMDAGLPLHSGQIDAPSGKWSFKLGPRNFPDSLDPVPPTAAASPDFLVFGRFFLEKIARDNGFGLDWVSCSVFFSTDALRTPFGSDTDPQRMMELTQALLSFPDKAHARHAWASEMRKGLSRTPPGGFVRSTFIEDKGLDPAADPYITVMRILDALRIEKA